MNNWRHLRRMGYLKRRFQELKRMVLSKNIEIFARPENENSEYCAQNKICYKDKRAAISEIRLLQKSGRKNTGALRAYYCSKCSGWHLTKQMLW